MRRTIPFASLAALCLACTCAAEEEGTPPPAAPVAPAPTEPSAATTAPAPTAGAFDPRQTGTRAYARFRQSGFAYAAVVTGVRGDGQIDVVYADGDTETLPPESLSPDAVRPGLRVEARIRSWRQWFPGVVQRRVGHAVFVHFDDGDEEWTSIGLVRLPADEVPTDVGTVPAPPSDVPFPEPGSRVVANYHDEGWYYPAVVAERRDDGQVHAIYADGDSEWLSPSQVRP
ncbi:MAG TPA: tudor domain-containing protein, partial [Sandaracinaceae bacterium LLY-WYZ-13_1]|nr:tudor domain-containing protein [Sandaracinaceae bacterium LLY-WYZ-13_1]